MYVSALLGLKFGLNVQLRVHLRPYFVRFLKFGLNVQLRVHVRPYFVRFLKFGLNVQLRVHVRPYFVRSKVRSKCLTTCT